MTAKTGQPGRPERLPPVLRRRGRAAPGADLTFFEYPGALRRAERAPAWCTASPGGSARRRRSRLLGRPPRGARASPSSEARARLAASPTPRASAHELVVDAERRPAAASPIHPEIPAELALHGLRGRPRLQLPATVDRGRARAPDERRAARRRPLRAARRRPPRRLDRARPDPGRARARPERRHDPPHRLEHDRRRARALARRAATRRRHPEQRDRRPPLLPLALLPRAGRRPATSSRRAEPGFTVDGACRGARRTRIILPPLPRAAAGPQIESRLTPLPDPRADWAPATR